MTEGSPHTLILSSSSKLPVGCPGARGEGYRATHQNTGACWVRGVQVILIHYQWKPHGKRLRAGVGKAGHQVKIVDQLE